MQEGIANVVTNTKLVKINVPLGEGYLCKTWIRRKGLFQRRTKDFVVIILGQILNVELNAFLQMICYRGNPDL